MLSYRRCRLAFVAVIDRLDAIEAEFVELEASLGSAEVLGDQSRREILKLLANSLKFPLVMSMIS